ncbi:MAG: Rid family hydrolase [Pseudomonadota bacterium]
MPDAISSVYGDVKKTLAAHGLTFASVVNETAYATDLDAFIKHQALRKAVYGDSFPAATWVQVTRLYSPSLVVEVELTAVFP